MARKTNDLSSLLTQHQKKIDALAIQLKNQFQALQNDVVHNTDKAVKAHLSSVDKKVDQLIHGLQKKLENQLIHEATKSLFGSSGAGSQSKSQSISALSNLLSSAWRNL